MRSDDTGVSYSADRRTVEDALGAQKGARVVDETKRAAIANINIKSGTAIYTQSPR
jgi:hypothetical protein